MLDGSNVATNDKSEFIDVDDAITLGRLPELVQHLEETAYALVRNGDAKNGNALFLAVVAAQRAVDTIAADKNSGSDQSLSAFFKTKG
ncbi:hypothetical protein SLH49_19970 [Cognatiyoonia sp. IB215446]|uniref:hypothetical protein n=1 Tax=Cognatiyoonia sp. IB215446 TaxID=3097355 RepID=UPI002A0E9335|nr:hypothetical protein [Cognatiyoonia sp. IB215446]MDX8350275.1 hypothetical protein [Cognatiyoonia sp. IB215446]